MEIDTILAQLWEECYDITELMEATVFKVKKQKAEFWNHGYKGVVSDGAGEQRCLQLLQGIVTDLDTTILNDVVNSLRVAVFSSVKEEEVDLLKYISMIRQVQGKLLKTRNKAFDLFIISLRMYQRTQVKYHIQRSSNIWEKVFRISNEIDAVVDKLNEISAPTEKDILDVTDSNYPIGGCEKDILIMLNSIVRLVKWKQECTPAGIANLVNIVEGLRLEVVKEFGEI